MHMRRFALLIAGLTCVSACTTRTQQLHPADILPAESTVAFVSGLTPNNTSAFGRWIGEADDAPLSDTAASSLAVVRMPDGHRAWVRFLPVADPHARFPYRIAASERAAEEMLGTGGTVLSAAKEYQAALSLHQHSAWAFVRVKDSWQGIQFGTGTIRLALPATLPASDSLHTMESPLSDTALVLHAGNADVIRTLSSLVPPDTAHAADAIMRTVFAELAGNEGTIHADVLPLLSQPFSLFVANADRATDMSFVLAGSSSEPQEHLARLHTLFRNRTLLMSEQERTFDGRFSSRNIRIDPLAIEDTQRDENGWHIRTTVRPDDNDTLVSATRDGRLIIGTDEDAVLRAINTEWVPTEPTDAALQPVLIGWMNRPVLPPSLRGLSSPLEQLSGSPGALRWTVERGNAALALTIEVQ